MKYRVYVKEIWIQPYIVDANSKAHAKNLVESSRHQTTLQVRKESGQPRPWGVIGSEKWDVEEIG
ncbi:MAG: hypothetical protein HQM13_10410 [SAR324 cluster bacterium]|nr:hypothetical protein [SAR324 cluster bacterium]